MLVSPVVRRAEDAVMYKVFPMSSYLIHPKPHKSKPPKKLCLLTIYPLEHTAQKTNRMDEDYYGTFAPPRGICCHWRKFCMAVDAPTSREGAANVIYGHQEYCPIITRINPNYLISMRLSHGAYNGHLLTDSGLVRALYKPYSGDEVFWYITMTDTHSNGRSPLTIGSDQWSRLSNRFERGSSRNRPYMVGGMDGADEREATSAESGAVNFKEASQDIRGGAAPVQLPFHPKQEGNGHHHQTCSCGKPISSGSVVRISTQVPVRAGDLRLERLAAPPDYSNIETGDLRGGAAPDSAAPRPVVRNVEQRRFNYGSGRHGGGRKTGTEPEPEGVSLRGGAATDNAPPKPVDKTVTRHCYSTIAGHFDQPEVQGRAVPNNAAPEPVDRNVELRCYCSGGSHIGRQVEAEPNYPDMRGGAVPDNAAPRPVVRNIAQKCVIAGKHHNKAKKTEPEDVEVDPRGGAALALVNEYAAPVRSCTQRCLDTGFMYQLRPRAREETLDIRGGAAPPVVRNTHQVCIGGNEEHTSLPRAESPKDERSSGAEPRTPSENSASGGEAKKREATKSVSGNSFNSLIYRESWPW